MSVAVIGSGVIGLSTAIILLERGYRVNLYSNKNDKNIASISACAIWMPFLMSGKIRGPMIQQEAEAKSWAETSWCIFKSIYKQNSKKTGISKVTHYEIIVDEEDEEILNPYYKDIVDNFSYVNDKTWKMDTFVIEMPIYMKWLKSRFYSLGGQEIDIVIDKVKIFSKIKENVAFNCTGLGSRELFDDNKFKAIKGQVLIHDVPTNNISLGIGEYCAIPRSDGLALGSLFIKDDETYNEDIEGSRWLYQEAASWSKDTIGSLVPIPKNIEKKKIATYVGIRPYREEGIRLEKESYGTGRKRKVIYHNYGHGGGGVTFSWGCARESVDMFEDRIREKLHLLNKDRPKLVSSVSIEIAHVELETVFKNRDKAADIINRSYKISNKIKCLLNIKDYSFNVVALIDDKSVKKHMSSKKYAEARAYVKQKLGELHVDYVVYESCLEDYAWELQKKYPGIFKLGAMKEHLGLSCYEDITIWYALRLGIIKIRKEHLIQLTPPIMQRRKHFESNRLISILEKRLTSVEESAINKIKKSFGSHISTVCGKHYF